MEILDTEWDIELSSDGGALLAALGVIGHFKTRHGIPWTSEEI
jgi:hypothetical protein